MLTSVRSIDVLSSPDVFTKIIFCSGPSSPSFLLLPSSPTPSDAHGSSSPPHLFTSRSTDETTIWKEKMLPVGSGEVEKKKKQLEREMEEAEEREEEEEMDEKEEEERLKEG
jgi:hypothetical protein